MIATLEHLSFFPLLLCFGAFFVGLVIRHQTGWSLCNPLLIALVICLTFMGITHMDYHFFEQGTRPLSIFLTPATVCYAVPLYSQWPHLRRCPKAILLGIGAGTVVGLLAIVAMASAFGLTRELSISLLPKSITTAIGIDLSAELGGIVAVTIAAIIITGNLGNLIAEPLCKLFKITDPVAQGLAIGTSSHALGTVKAMEISELTGAISSLAIVITGLLTVILAPFFLRLI